MFKIPIPEVMLSDSMLVPHDSITNNAVAAATTDKGLVPNGITIDAMRENPEFYQQSDDLDRAAIAAKESGKLTSDVKKVVSAFKRAQTDRNKPKNSY